MLSCHPSVAALTRLASLQAVLAHSLPLKEAKAGFTHLALWGRVTTRNGKVTVLHDTRPAWFIMLQAEAD